MDKAKILRLCNEINDKIVELWNCEQIEHDDAQHIISLLDLIGFEVSAKPKSNADRIRQMTDEELAHLMVIQAIMGAISVNGIQDKATADKIAKEIIMEHKADEDISNVLKLLKQEVIEDAEED